jgi:hypothetical protein
MEKEAEPQGKAGEVNRTYGRGWPPVAHPRKHLQQPTKLDMPEHFSGFQMMIITIF